MTASTTATALTSIDQHDATGLAQALADDGYAFVPGALAAAEVAEARRRIDELVHFGWDRASEDGRGKDHWKCVFNRSPYWLRFIDRPGIVDGIEQVLGENCHITGQTAWRTFPGDGAERPPLHVDQLLFPVPEELARSGQVRIPCYLLTLHFYLSDIDEDLCPTWIVPGSHRSGRGPGAGTANANNPQSDRGFLAGEERSWNGEAERPVLCRAGDALVFRSEVWHRGSRNRTPDRVRYLLQVHYGARQMAQRFSPYTEFAYNREVLAAANPRQRRLLGAHTPTAYD